MPVMKLETRPTLSLIFLLGILITTASLVEGFNKQGNMEMQGNHFSFTLTWRKKIGSTMPTCTYNECRGCKYRCIAEQIPVEGNDPINSAYHYRCVCRHRNS